MLVNGTSLNRIVDLKTPVLEQLLEACLRFFISCIGCPKKGVDYPYDYASMIQNTLLYTFKTY